MQDDRRIARVEKEKNVDSVHDRRRPKPTHHARAMALQRQPSVNKSSEFSGLELDLFAVRTSQEGN